MTRITAGSSILLAALLASVTACSDGTGPRKLTTLPDSLPSLIVSGPVHGLGGLASFTASAPGASGSGSVAYVSLPPGSVPAGLEATIRDLATGLVVTTVVVDGGFDPVAIAASVGDTLGVDIARSGSAAPIHGWELVKANRPPVVVRTDPPPQKRDVPLNSIMVVVFSDPIDSATLNTGSVQLWRGTTPLAGTVRFSDAAGIRAEFHPDSLLASQTDYRLVVTPTIRDVNGLALASALDVPFTTGITPPPPPGLVLASVSAGGRHSCGVTTSGAAYCWGENVLGQLGNGTYASSATPVPVAGGLTFATVSAGAAHTCGVTTSGAAYCWGWGFDGQLGAGLPLPSNCGSIGRGENGCATPVAVAGALTFATVSAAGENTCGVTTGGAAYCWGDNYAGVLGCDSSCASDYVPQAVVGGLAFATVSAGGISTCGVTTSGAAYCWGDNSRGELGIDPTAGPEKCPNYLLDSVVMYPCSPRPVAVGSGLTFAVVSAGMQLCGVTTDHHAYCWGSNDYGQLGSLDACCTFSVAPVAVSGGLSFAWVGTGVDRSCGVTTSGVAYCWGRNNKSQLGDGTTTDRRTPAVVAGNLSFKMLSLGAEHTCGVTTDGDAYCWGYNGFGQLGNGTATDSTVPVKVAGQP